MAGSVNGGSALVVHKGSPLKNAGDFRGKKIATPQFGNTQDVAARSWLSAGGLRIAQTGGDAQVVPTANPDQIGALALGLQTLPSVCWVPLALLWFGQTETAMLFVVVMG
ncbi:MAG: hypothetical protein WCD73_18390, partial [Pseudolabrys sp.]